MNRDSNEITREYFDSLLVEMRHIDSVKPTSEITVFGEKFRMPVATAALSHMNNTAEDGMVKMAEGARLAGALCFSGMGEKQEITDMCATGAKVIKIIKPHADNNNVIKEIRDAEEAGAFGVGMDIDHAFAWNAEYDCVCVGRAIMPPLKDNGAEGVCEKMKLIDAQLRYFMARTGAADISGIDPTVIHKRDF